MSSTAEVPNLLDELLRHAAAHSLTGAAPPAPDETIDHEVATMRNGSTAHSSIPVDDLEQLRALLFAPEWQRIATIEAQVAELQAQLQQSERFVAMLAPIVAQAIAQKVRDSREEMAEALYPVIGKSITRAVQEALRDLARNIDETMRRSLRPQFIQRFEMRLRGVDPNEAALRSALPFQVHEMLLIHRESGLLLLHRSFTGTLPDADLISGMLTAIRSYVQDSFGTQADGSLDAISYGEMRIIIEEGSAAILAVVSKGIEPNGFPERMREQLSALHAALGSVLRAYDGTSIDEQVLLPYLEPIMEQSS